MSLTITTRPKYMSFQQLAQIIDGHKNPLEGTKLYSSKKTEITMPTKRNPNTIAVWIRDGLTEHVESVRYDGKQAAL